jgi:hypothetical protein
MERYDGARIALTPTSSRRCKAESTACGSRMPPACAASPASRGCVMPTRQRSASSSVAAPQEHQLHQLLLDSLQGLQAIQLHQTEMIEDLLQQQASQEQQVQQVLHQMEVMQHTHLRAAAAAAAAAARRCGGGDYRRCLPRLPQQKKSVTQKCNILCANFFERLAP